MSQTKSAKRPAGAGKQTVLITGVTSAIGRSLARALLEGRHVGYVLGIGSEPGPRGLSSLDPARFQYRKVDLLRQRDLTSLFKSEEFRTRPPGTVVHLAFSRRPESAQTAHRLNVEGTKLLLDKCLQAGFVRKFVFRSSGMVYKVRADGPVELCEDDDLDFDPGRHPIVRDEVAAEMICRSRMDSRRTAIVILRPSALVGAGLHTFFNAYLESSLCLRVAGYNPLVNILPLEDFVRALVLAVRKSVRGVFNIAGKETLPLSDLARLSGTPQWQVPESLAPVAGNLLRRLRLTGFDATVGLERLKHSCLLDTGRARALLGYVPEHSMGFGDLARREMERQDRGLLGALTP